MKPNLKLPGTKRLKLKYDGPVSNFAFRFNLRHYIMFGYFIRKADKRFSLDRATGGGITAHPKVSSSYDAPVEVGLHPPPLESILV
jgi:hypothetical protein